MSVYRIKCVVCGKQATKKSKRAMYCSGGCKQRAYEERQGIKPPEWLSKDSKPKKAKPEPIISNQYLNQINQMVDPFSPREQKLHDRKEYLINRFTKLSMKDQKSKTLGEAFAVAAGLKMGFDNLKEDDTVLDLAFNLIGIPVLFRYAAKNFIGPMSGNGDLKDMKLDSIRSEINKIDEELNIIELQKRGKEQALKIAQEASSPQIERTDSFTSIPAQEMKKIKRTTYKLKDKWGYFLGTIEQNFKALIHGKPKQGKSHFAIQFAQYLHENHGDAVYFAAEEGASINMENKLTRWDAKFNVVYNILGTKGIEDYIKKYKPKFVFIDSISRLSLSYDNIKFFVDEYIDTAWIMVAQSTKHNSHRGSQELTHLTESNINVIDGVAYQKGRTVNGETEIEIFAK